MTLLALAVAAIVCALFLLAGWVIDLPEPNVPRQAREEHRRPVQSQSGIMAWRGILSSGRAACGACSAGNHDECFGGDCDCCPARRRRNRRLRPTTRYLIPDELTGLLVDADVLILRTRTLLTIGI